MDAATENTLKEIRGDVRFVRDKVISHDTILIQWFGNGQPGIMKSVMDDIEDLKRLKWKLIGAGAVLIGFMEILHVILENSAKMIYK